MATWCSNMENWLASLQSKLETTRVAITLANLSEDDAPLSYVNVGFEAETGYLRGQVVGNNCRFLQGPESDPTAIGQLRSSIQSRQETAVCLTNYKCDGSKFENLVMLNFFRSPQQDWMCLGCQYELTKQFRRPGLEEHVASVQGVLATLKAGGAFVSDMAIDAIWMRTQAVQHLDTNHFTRLHLGNPFADSEN